MAVHEGQIWRLGSILNDMQSEFFPDIDIPIKFHAVELNSGHGRFRSLSDSERQRMLDAIYDAIGRIPYPRVVLFATAAHISSVTSSDQALRDTFEDVAQRINTFLVRLHHDRNPQKGLLIIDRSQSTEKRYLALLSEFRASETRHSYLGNIVDIPYFSQSSETRLLQLADFVAYAVFRYYERGDDRLLNKILPRFDRRAPTSGIDGLKHVIETSNPCDCVACAWRVSYGR